LLPDNHLAYTFYGQQPFAQLWKKPDAACPGRCLQAEGIAALVACQRGALAGVSSSTAAAGGASAGVSSNTPQAGANVVQPKAMPKRRLTPPAAATGAPPPESWRLDKDTTAAGPPSPASMAPPVSPAALDDAPTMRAKLRAAKLRAEAAQLQASAGAPPLESWRLDKDTRVASPPSPASLTRRWQPSSFDEGPTAKAKVRQLNLELRDSCANDGAIAAALGDLINGPTPGESSRIRRVRSHSSTPAASTRPGRQKRSRSWHFQVLVPATVEVYVVDDSEDESDFEEVRDRVFCLPATSSAEALAAVAAPPADDAMDAESVAPEQDTAIPDGDPIVFPAVGVPPPAVQAEEQPGYVQPDEEPGYALPAGKAAPPSLIWQRFSARATMAPDPSGVAGDSSGGSSTPAVATGASAGGSSVRSTSGRLMPALLPAFNQTASPPPAADRTPSASPPSGPGPILSATPGGGVHLLRAYQEMLERSVAKRLATGHSASGPGTAYLAFLRLSPDQRLIHLLGPPPTPDHHAAASPTRPPPPPRPPPPHPQQQIDQELLASQRD